MLIDDILDNCNKRYSNHNCNEQCAHCSYGEFCPRKCQDCLDYIHDPSHAQPGSPNRKYDCPNMADVYTCKYSYRYTSEMIYAFKRLKDIRNTDILKVLSFGCGPCTDLFALDYLKETNMIKYNKIKYRGIDYSENVWSNIHADLKNSENESRKINFFYEDACTIIDEIVQGTWYPNLISFQYVFSDMKKHSSESDVQAFITKCADFINDYLPKETYIVLNDINLCNSRGGGRDYFYKLFNQLNCCTMRCGRFHNDNKNYTYPYGDNSDGQFPQNDNFFQWRTSYQEKYSPFDTCASAQMIIKKEG